ncbi:class II glutamine amidotransferase [Hyalangium gracile]|uniref:class II glutamine amidotransferase n=1 Tax=Hyalangium gracile TaxID=394092 RepID=UPI001CCECC5E|nr:class II glutamine amidotransferase [Hyalangium gracile]
MPNLLAMSFEGELAPSLDLRCLAPGNKPPDGWGVGYYPGSEPAAAVLKEPRPPPGGSIRSELVKAWEHLESSLLLLHIRTASWGAITDANTQPFCRSYAGRDWLFGHSGTLRQAVQLPVDPAFEPVGSSDSESVFCALLSWIQASGWKRLGDVDLERLRAWLEEMNGLGPLTVVFTDGHDLCIYADREQSTKAWMWRVAPPYERLVIGDDDVEVDLTKRGAKSRKGVIFSTQPIESRTAEVKANWTPIVPGGLVMVRQGAIRAEVLPPGVKREPGKDTSTAAELAARGTLRRPPVAPVRVMDVRHRTVYRYERPVERSAHVLRLTPVHDRLQSLRSHELRMSPGVLQSEYEDVFGNHVRKALIETPYTELVIEANSRVELRDTDPLGHRAPHIRTTFPVLWMPSQQVMLQPYLQPPPLPDSELEELLEYAMSFARRNDFDLLDTLLDLNFSIYKEYQYIQGVTHLNTSAFEVYSARRGVCQDFTNLFLCLARLLGLPARYTCGYIYTGPKHANTQQAEASHAWAQVYLPERGWRGFDPTNGVLTQTNHVRVATGRTHRDATPTSGTIYVGGSIERLEVTVVCEPVE